MSRTSPTWCIVIGVVLATLAGGCQSAYYGAWEAFGVHKRDILVDRVQDAKEDQEAAKEEFRDALKAFTAVTNYDGGGLQQLYNTLSDEMDDCESRAGRVRDRIASVDDVANDLFDEWSGELEQYSSDDLRRRSEQQLRATRAKYDKLYDAMKRAESRMEPVLVTFRDHVMFLKHNLNAQAIASLEGEASTLETEVGRLIAEMEDAIAEANSFIDSMAT